jgi:sterol desaturase/sphingolipid hydroxylase (fatty acid hydroxylase superfamily)
MNALRYIFFAGGAFILFWMLFGRRLEHRRIQKRDVPGSQIIREVLYSISTILIFGLSGMFLIWYLRSGGRPLFEIALEPGFLFNSIAVILLVVVHDAYFYFAHRLMHHRRLFRITHALHHRSIQPTPFAAFAFQPVEAVLQALYVVIVVLLFPVTPISLMVFLFYSFIMNVLGHLGYEFMPSGFTRNRWTYLNNTSTHHAMHHRYVTCNYGLYFNWWDRIFKSNHERYDESFEAVVEGKGLEASRASS